MMDETSFGATFLWDEGDRFLDDANSTIVDSATVASTVNDRQVLKDTFAVYGSLLLVLFLLFCFVRRSFPHAYQLRNWVPHIKSPIAEDQYGFFSWMWRLNAITEDELMDECGMDALCVLRLLRMGYRICFVSVLNSIWLMPLYALAPEDSVTKTITDPIVKMTLAHVAAGSPRLIGTVLAAYVLFGYVMYQILREFEWFIQMRHIYLKKPTTENYSVYVRNVPPEYRSNAALHEYFASCFSDEAVLETKLRIKAPKLVAAVKQRDALVDKLEHALNYEMVKGQPPMHREKRPLGERVYSIPSYARALFEANRNVTEMIETMEQATRTVSAPIEESLPLTINQGPTEFEDETGSELQSDSQTRLLEPTVDAVDENRKGSKRNLLSQGVGRMATKSLSATKVLAKSASKLIQPAKEGDFIAAGFVTFRSLGFTHSVRQMVHHGKPFDIEVVAAPRSDDIFWGNVGRSHKDLQIGKLASLAATVAVCFLWTIPMTFMASLSSVEGLRAQVPFLDDLIGRFPFLSRFFQIVAPLLVKVVNGMLPTILTWFTLLEGPVSSSVVVASLFTKLATFMIVQTFFVSAIGGSIMQEIGDVIDDPLSIVDILAKSLPAQSTYFVQIVLVGTAVGTSLEILRVQPLIFALIRKFLPPNLTEKERQKTVFGMFRPLADPDDFGHAANLAQVVLNFIIMLVYAVIAPLTVYIQAFCFIIMMICYRHQFVYIYPKNPDSGGKIWTNFISVLLPCLLIAEFTIVGFLAIKKSPVASPMMFPLIVVTVLFNAYIRQQHFRVAENLPSRDCMQQDIQNGVDFDLSFTTNAYLQLELREKVKLPEDLSVDRAKEIGLID